MAGGTTAKRPSARAPRRTGRSEIANLPLDPVDSFLLSQIDGSTTVEDLELVTGLPAGKIGEVTEKLVSLGLVELPAESPAPVPTVEPAAKSERRTAFRLLPEQARRIDEVLALVEGGVGHYDVLGVPADATRSQVRAAFFKLSKEFHPDAYYGFDLGPYRVALERIFRCLSKAYEVLSKARSRQSYDEYRVGQAVLDGLRNVADEVGDAAAEPVGPAFAPPEEPPGGPAPADLSSAARQVIEPAAARVRPAPSPHGAQRSASEAWRKQRTVRELAAALGIGRQGTSRSRGLEFFEDAREAVEAGEWGRAIGLVEVAERLGVGSGREEDLRALAARVRAEMATVCCRQATFADGLGDVAEAIKHAEAACKYGPDASEHWEVRARLLLRQGKDLHGAKDAAQRAVMLGPGVAANRLTLARVYIAAGLAKNARREAEAAVKLSDGSDEAKRVLAATKQVTE